MGDSQKLTVAVLVVEDEPLIRMDAASLLEDAGYAVFQAGSAAQAIQILELHTEIQLVFTDVNMPGSMDGIKLAHYVRGRWPPIKIILTSGGGEVRAEELPEGAVFVGKPYHPHVLTQKVRELAAA